MQVTNQTGILEVRKHNSELLAMVLSDGQEVDFSSTNQQQLKGKWTLKILFLFLCFFEFIAKWIGFMKKKKTHVKRLTEQFHTKISLDEFLFVYAKLLNVFA